MIISLTKPRKGALEVELNLKYRLGQLIFITDLSPSDSATFQLSYIMFLIWVRDRVRFAQIVGKERREKE